MINKTTKRRPLWKNAGFYMILIYAALSIGLAVQIFTTNIMPIKYAIPLTLILLLLLLIMSFLQFGKRVNKLNRILGKVLIVILSVLLGFGNWYLYVADSTIKTVAKNNKQTDVVSVIVMKDNAMKKIEDVKGKKLGKVMTGDTNLLDQAIEDIEKDIKDDAQVVEYTSYKAYADALYDGSVDAILVNEATRSLFEDSHSDFDEKTRAIKQYSYEKETKDQSKDVNVTKDAFNVYITGIDTYGSISTVSRSDVNMIVSINPKTHQVLLTSIPRDYYIPQTCQAGQTDKLTHTGIFGVQCTIDSAEEYFKVSLNYYVRVNFSSVEDIVNALGGITVDNPVTFTASDGTYYYPEGQLDMDGAMALRFARERKNLADGDRDRGRNQMRVITGMINKMISPSIITNYTSFMNAIAGSFQTNMDSNSMTSFIKMQLNDMKDWDIKQISVSGSGNGSAWSPANGSNAWVMEPNLDTVHNAVQLIKKLEKGQTITDEDVQHQNELVENAG